MILPIILGMFIENYMAKFRNIICMHIFNATLGRILQKCKELILFGLLLLHFIDYYVLIRNGLQFCIVEKGLRY